MHEQQVWYIILLVVGLLLTHCQISETATHYTLHHQLF